MDCRQAQRRQTEFRSLRIRLGDRKRRTDIGSSVTAGAWQGFKTQISRYVDDKLTVVVLANLAEAEPGKIAEHVAEFYLSGSGQK